MMKTINEIKEIWDSIPKNIEGFLELDIDSPLSFHIGINNYGYLCFLFITDKDINIPNSSKKIIINNIELGDNEYAISFSLIDDNFQDIFKKICWDIIYFTKQQKADYVEALIKRYYSWVKLLESEGGKIISLNRQKGLLGELYFLNKLLKEKDPETVINCWMGPEKADQDFIFQKDWFEVKTINKSKNKVSISSIEQLDQENIGYLVVNYCEKTSLKDELGISLNELIGNIYDQLTSELIKNSFEMKLLKFDLSLSDYKQ